MSVKNSQIRYTFIIFRFQFLSKENLKKFNIFFARNYTHIYVHKQQKDKNLSALNFTDVDAVLYTRQQPHL